MKKILSLCLASFLLLMMFAGCSSSKKNSDDIITISISEEAKKYAEETAAVNAAAVEAFSEENFEETFKKLYSNRTEQTFPECNVKNTLTAEEFKGCKVYNLSKENYENIVLYVHGGAWTNGIGTDHIGFCDALVNKLNAIVYMPLYPLAPQANSTETYDMLEAFYNEILKEGKDIYLMGDSAGGNIALGLLYNMKENGIQYPKKTVLLSPCVDMSFSNEAMAELEKTDPLLRVYGSKKCAECWAGKDNLKDPKNSALYADVTGYPDIMIVQGTNEIIYPDVMLFYDKLKDAGVNVTMVVGDGLWHVFPVDEIPEKDTVLDLIDQFRKK